MKRAFATLVVLVLTGGVAIAQENAQAQEKTKGKEKSVEVARPEAQRREEVGQPVNIRLDVTITDQQGSAPPIVKTLTTLVADNWQSRVRTEGSTLMSPGNASPIALNMDARPRIMTNTRDRILLIMTIEYRPSGMETKPGASAVTLNQSLQVILQDGQQLLISQSADPNTDRKVKLEVKATILR